MSEEKQKFPDYEVHKLHGHPSKLQRQSGIRILGIFRNLADENTFTRCPWRYFEFFSISHLLNGHGRFAVKDGKEFDINIGDVVVMPPGVVHRYGGCNDIYDEESIIFNGPVIEHMRESGVITPGVFKMGKLPRFQRINDLFRNPDKTSQLNANFELQKMIMEIYNSGLKQEPDIIDQITEKIRSNLAYWWTVEELADLCGLSCDQFRRKFIRRTGLLPKAYIEQAKLRMAAAMISNDKEKLSLIAEKLGYQDFFHFSRRFKKLFGIPPSEYRNKILDI